MASVTFPSAIGGDDSTVTDDSNVSTGLANGGHRTRFIPSLSQFVTCAQFVLTAVQTALASAQAAANSALNAPATNATSTTSLAIGTGSKTFTIQTGKAFSIGQTMVAASAANPNNQMVGVVTAHNSGTGSITINVSNVGGSGTFADWTLSLASSSGVQTVAGLNGAVTAPALKTALAITSADVTDFDTRMTQQQAFAIAFAIAL